MQEKRNIGIDILKVLGTLLIMLAHVNPPVIIFQARNFDVVLLVIVSGMLFSNSYKRSKGYFQYTIKRFIRLVIPVWICLTIFFLGNYICSTYFLLGTIYSLNTIVSSFFMIGNNTIRICMDF